MKESAELDDFEFQCFTILRKWRKKTYEELGIEPYKVFQNRTLCEMIRRRRNDFRWARSDPSESEDKNSDSVSEKVVDDLLQCWGIGPSKVRQPDGYALLAIDSLNDVEADHLLKQSVAEYGKTNNKAIESGIPN